MVRKEKEDEEGDEEKSSEISCAVRKLGCSQQTQHHCYQVIRTTRVHQSSRSSRMVSVQEKVIRSRLQLGYSTPTSFINRLIERVKRSIDHQEAWFHSPFEIARDIIETRSVNSNRILPEIH
uniref:Uncharacterized protein n=1 Tax=Vespula pensylvanica TaxID=30213 RepID=A0A834NSF2_VESPE|nr:hypothetical protein H0235_011677 [Vespula pensylvanica]